MYTIGFLLPRSTFYQGISFDLFEGLRSSLAECGQTDVRILTENIGFGTDKQLCYKSAEQLVMHENAQIVFAYIGHSTAQVLRPLFTAANRLLVVLDAGAHLPQEWPVSPNIFYHSFQNALGAWLSARMAVQDGHRSGAMVTGYYDGGYLHTVGAHGGFIHAGGQIQFNLATGYRAEDFSMQPLKEQYNPSEDSCLLSIFSGDYLQWFFRDLVQYFPEQQLPVYLPPFAFEESMLKEAVYPGDHVKGIAVWAQRLKNEENAAFKNAMERAGRDANLFSLLGWEAGIIANFIMTQESSNARVTGEALKQFAFSSPRGAVAFHPATQCSLGPMYEVAIENDGNGNCAVNVTGEITDVHEAFNTLITQEVGEAVSGWYNSYTCI